MPAREPSPRTAEAYGRRLLASAAIIGVLALVSALVAVGVGRDIQRSWNSILDEDVATVRAAADLHLRLFQQKGLVAGYLLEGDERQLADLEAGREDTAKSLESVASVALSGPEAVIADRIRAQYERYDERRQDVIELVRQGRLAEARRIYVGEVTNDVAGLGLACEDMLEANEHLVQASRAEIARLQQRLEWLLGLGAAGVLLAGTCGGWLIARDITRHQARLSRMAALGHVTSALAHEVRNPLSAITLRLESLDAEPGLPPVIKEDVQVMRHEVARLERLVNNILLNAQLPPPRLRGIQVAEVVGRTLEVLRPAFEQQGVHVESCCGPDGAGVLADPEQLSQVLLNVQLNALQVMPRGGTLRIEARPVAANGSATASGQGFVEIRVQDSGPGIPDELRAQICEPFFTTRRNGLGLGLAIARQIVERHSGDLAFEPAEPTGTTVVIRLPQAHIQGETA